MENRDDCIVCAKSFHNPMQERITCSDECRKKWRDFMEEHKTIPKEKRQKYCDRFFTNTYWKMMLK